MSAPTQPGSCTPKYASHRWVWVNGQHRCLDCTTVDLRAARLVRAAVAALARRGVRIAGAGQHGR